MRFPFDFNITNGLPRWQTNKPLSRLNSISRVYRPTYGANIVIDMALGDYAVIVVTNANAFTIANPLNDPGEGCTLTLLVCNNSGGVMGAVTFGTKYKTQAGIAFPANGNAREYDFTKVNGLTGLGDTWEMHSSGADVPNPA